ncbi:imidazole glycerol phosphate synthase subunit HisH [Saccharibacillus sp. CPCC 101409]|uniref:imidazole glycerol phosphate synthase subunit HisH n=1 Tax=Saccharibacillus sp. CPCC 101409 TaxID=3058041 RepID=UPI0026713844|nr:imidazole glycerol phosphate synthase subunit HisH [Saccharibacillus sp. CPCC 101409]MDO3413122.1 imidazole glycerol phosphate synthase subunit HisH [Saccharibacillus sp. CPCC 101409]
MTIAIVDYGMGNLHSVSKAVERLGYDYLITGDEREILESSGVLLPGVGAFGDAMSHLQDTGLDLTVRKAAGEGKPLLGICLGMQLLFDGSDEHGKHEGLGLLPGRAVRFEAGELKVPHMGWNRLDFARGGEPLLDGLEEGHVYFVHSYHVELGEPGDLIASADYGLPVTAIVGRDNVYGMQFHPEKSGELGMSLLRNFLKLSEGRAQA